MTRRPLLLLALAVLAVGCKNSNTWDGTYKMDGEWEVWSAENTNNCFMLSLGPSYYLALLETDADEDIYSFTGSDNGDRCWPPEPREYTRVGNQLLSAPPDQTGYLYTGDICEIRIARSRVATFSSNDVFTEVSTVTVSWDASDDCPVGPETGQSCPGGQGDCCHAEFVSYGARCTDCWIGCDAAAATGDPVVIFTLLDGGGSR